MFGEMTVVPIIKHRCNGEIPSQSVGEAVATLLEMTDQPNIKRWVQMPKGVLVFLLVPDDPESGALYVFDRRTETWLWIDFNDEKFGGYTVDDFDCLVDECRLLDFVERPHLLRGGAKWIVRRGFPPQRAATAASDAHPV